MSVSAKGQLSEVVGGWDHATTPMSMGCQGPTQPLPQHVSLQTIHPSDQSQRTCCTSLQMLVNPVSPALPALSCGCTFGALSADTQHTDQPTFSEIVESLGKLELGDLPSPWWPEQEQTWEKHEQLPTSLSAVLVELTGFLQNQPHSAAEWASEKMRHCLHHRSSLTEFHHQINRVQFHQGGSDRWGDPSKLHHHGVWLTGRAQTRHRHSLPMRRHCPKPHSLCLRPRPS